MLIVCCQFSIKWESFAKEAWFIHCIQELLNDKVTLIDFGHQKGEVFEILINLILFRYTVSWNFSEDLILAIVRLFSSLKLCIANNTSHSNVMYLKLIWSKIVKILLKIWYSIFRLKHWILLFLTFLLICNINLCYRSPLMLTF